MLTTLNIISLIASLLSLLACLWLFSSYLHVHPHRRSIALEMILILGISDFIQAIASAAIFITLEDFIPCQILQYVINFSTFFSLFWATALAVFSAVSFSQIMAFQNKARRFFYFALITSLLISALLPIPMLVNFSGTGYTSIAAKQFDICSHGYSGVATIKTKVINLLFIQFGPCFLAVCVTSFCYIKVAFALKTASVEVMDNWMINPKFLMWYPLGTMMLYLPFLAAAVVYETEGTSDFCDYFWRICIRLCGFVNSVVYLTMRKRIKKSKLDTHSILPPNQGLNATLGNDQKITITEGFEIKTPNPQMG